MIAFLQLAYQFFPVKTYILDQKVWRDRRNSLTCLVGIITCDIREIQRHLNFWEGLRRERPPPYITRRYQDGGIEVEDTSVQVAESYGKEVTLSVDLKIGKCWECKIRGEAIEGYGDSQCPIARGICERSDGAERKAGDSGDGEDEYDDDARNKQGELSIASMASTKRTRSITQRGTI